ncbi:MAG: hypothetical protein ACQEV7_07790 [Bacillota bacterium]
MQHAITYSIIEHLRNQVPEASEVIWVYDGVSLSNRVKPFLTVEQMQTDNELLAAGRTDYGETYRFQIGLRARNISERSRLSDVMLHVLRQPNIPLLDTRVSPSPVIGVFVCDVPAVTPMQSEDLSNETDKHRVYFDVEVEIQRVNGEFNITQ